MKKRLILLFIFLVNLNFIFAEQITFSAGSMSGQNGKKNSKTVLAGNAFVKTKTMEIYADSIELSGEDYRNILATGNVRGINYEAKMDFTCNSLEYDRKTKIALLQGDVQLDDKENDVKANAQIIEYNQDKEVAIMQIQITLTQKNNVCNGAYAIYQKKTQMLEISGNAQVKQNNDTFRAQQISLNLDTQEITLEGNVKGSVTEENSKENANENANENNTQKAVEEIKTEPEQNKVEKQDALQS